MAKRPRNPDQTMETTTPFELNRAIQQWHENLAQSPAFRRENLDEPEAHLHDAIPELQKCGLSIEEAFIVAARRIGTNHSLAPEYAKVNGSSIYCHSFALPPVRCFNGGR